MILSMLIRAILSGEGDNIFPMKVLGGYGEAGVVVTDNADIYPRLKRLRHAGTTSDPKKLITNNCLEVSLNHKMDTINECKLHPFKTAFKYGMSDISCDNL